MSNIIRSVKLSFPLRKRLAAELMNGKYQKEFDQLYVRAKDLAQACYEYYYELEEPGMLAKMKRLPDGWLPENDAILVKFGVGTDKYKKLHFNGLSRFLPWKDSTLVKPEKSEKRIFRQQDLYKSPQLVLNKSDRLYAVYNQIEIDATFYKNEKEKLEREINSVLCSVGTTKKLIEVWPEAAPAVSKVSPTISAEKLLPVKVLTNLNEKLGLPKEKTKAA